MEEEKKRFYDTSAALNLQEKIFDTSFIISYITIKELENIKTSATKDADVKYKARNIVRLLSANTDKYEVCMQGKDECIKYNFDLTNDNIILSGAIAYNLFSPIEFYTDDLLLQLMARNASLLVKSSRDILEDETEYLGYKEVVLLEDRMAYFYEHLNENQFHCLTNEYLVIRNQENEIIEKRKWNGDKYEPLSYKQINNDFTGRVKPINLQQELAFDMLQDKKITIKVLTGKQGSGKSYLMVAHAMQQIKSGKKIMWVRNTIEVKDTKPIGFLPSSKNDKMLPFCGSLMDHCGGIDGLNKLINDSAVEIEHLGFMRGRDLKNTCLIINEAGNITKDHLQLLIGRIGDGSSLWLDGDLLQIDSKTFETDNGLKSAVEKLKGQRLFGFVQLQDCERSETAKLADLLN